MDSSSASNSTNSLNSNQQQQKQQLPKQPKRPLSESTQKLIDKTKKYLTNEAGIILLQNQKIPQKQIEFTIKLSVDKDFKNVSNVTTTKNQIPILTTKAQNLSGAGVTTPTPTPTNNKTFSWKRVPLSPSSTSSNIPIATNRLYESSSSSLNTKSSSIRMDSQDSSTINKAKITPKKQLDENLVKIGEQTFKKGLLQNGKLVIYLTENQLKQLLKQQAIIVSNKEKSNEEGKEAQSKEDANKEENKGNGQKEAQNENKASGNTSGVSANITKEASASGGQQNDSSKTEQVYEQHTIVLNSENHFTPGSTVHLIPNTIIQSNKTMETVVKIEKPKTEVVAKVEVKLNEEKQETKDFPNQTVIESPTKTNKKILDSFIKTLKTNFTENNNKINWANMAKFYNQQPANDITCLTTIIDQLKESAKSQFHQSHLNLLKKDKNLETYLLLNNQNWSKLKAKIDLEPDRIEKFHSVKNITPLISTFNLCDLIDKLRNINEENLEPDNCWSMLNIEIINKPLETNAQVLNYEFDSNYSSISVSEQQLIILNFIENLKSDLNNWTKVCMEMLLKPDEIKKEQLFYDIKCNDLKMIDCLMKDVRDSDGKWTKVNIDAIDGDNEIKKYQIVNDYYGAIDVLENLIDNFKTGKDKWVKLNAESLFQIPIGMYETQNYEIINDGSHHMIDNLIENIKQNEERWSKLKFNVSYKPNDLIINEEVINYEIKKADETKLHLLETICKNLKADSDKWEQCNIKVITDVPTSIEVNVEKKSEMFQESLKKFEEYFQTKWDKINVAVELDNTTDRSVEFNFGPNNFDIGKLERVLEVLRKSPLDLPEFEKTKWLEYNVKIIENIKVFGDAKAIELLDKYKDDLQIDTALGYTNDGIVTSIQILGLFLFKIKNILKLLNGTAQQKKVVQIQQQPPPKPVSIESAQRKNTAYSHMKPMTRVYELDCKSSIKSELASSVRQNELNRSNTAAAVTTAASIHSVYDKPFVIKKSNNANTLVINTGLKNSDYVQIHPLLNDKTKIRKSDSGDSTRYDGSSFDDRSSMNSSKNCFENFKIIDFPMYVQGLNINQQNNTPYSDRSSFASNSSQILNPPNFGGLKVDKDQYVTQMIHDYNNIHYIRVNDSVQTKVI